MALPDFSPTQPKRVHPKPAWLGETPYISSGNHDSIPIFMRRKGGGTTWQEESYKNSYTEETARKIKAAGVTMWVTYFYKGFGMEAEKEYIERVTNFAPVLQKHGIKVGLYVGSTIAYETFLVEKPEAEEWLVPDYLGKPVFYDSQPFRRRVYFMHPGYLEYMKRVVTIGVRDVKADMIHFDNTSMQAQPPIFQHPMAVKDFRAYLQAKYSPAQLEERLGFSDLRYVRPPKWGQPLSAIDDPLFQEWADFRCYQLNSYYAIMETLIHSLNPNCVIHSNPHSELSGRNTIWEQGVNYPGLFAHMDAVTSEEGDPAGVTSNGILVNRIRSFKNAAILNNPLFVYTGQSALQMAESLAFSRQSIGSVGEVLESGLPTQQRRYVNFFREKFGHYRGVENIADVAVLYSYASMGFNNDRPAVSFMLCSQVLIQARIPFDIIFNEHLKDLSKYRVLVLADQECLGDEQMDQIRNFVKNGGGLVATELSSLYTPWRQRRQEFGLKDLFQVESPRFGYLGAVEMLELGPVRNRVGQGRVVYIGDVRAAIQKPPGAWMTSQYWKLPLNWEELLGAVEWAAGDRLTIEVNAPLTQNVVVELMKQEGKLLVHLLNYDVARAPHVDNIQVDLKVPGGKSVSHVRLLTPDRDEEETAAPASRDGRVQFIVPRLETYTLAVVELT
jgi:Beta-galactosidase trimerisation domain